LPPQEITRPTTDRVREALFSVLTSRLQGFDGLTVVDAFAGSGALGLEALSRGAASVIFAESSAKVRAFLTMNLKALGQDAHIARDYIQLPKAVTPADVVFLDPPYGQGLEVKAVETLQKLGHIGPQTLVVIETAADQVLGELAGFECLDVRRYGHCAVSLWMCNFQQI
jgi:16S rRNA (guanine966-N2)-methyltransferase